jgi:hypothetical protein
MKTYNVVWTIDLEAESAEDAARQAWEAMRRENSSANYFSVQDDDGNVTDIDLQELDA